MIKYNDKDKFLEDICEPLKGLPMLKSPKAKTAMVVYGMSDERGYDVAVPITFPGGDRLIEVYRRQGLKIARDVYWGKAPSYGNRVLGLGFSIRKNDPETCKRIILTAFGAMNSIGI